MSATDKLIRRKEIASEINELHKELTTLVKRSLEYALEVGGMLQGIKEELPHGEFTQWIEENLEFTPRTARNYLKLHSNRDKITGAESISDAYKLLTPKTETVSVSNNGTSNIGDSIPSKLPERYDRETGEIIEDGTITEDDRNWANEVRERKGIGLQKAHEAISKLKQIPPNDGLLEEAYETVIQWIKHNR